MHIVERESWDVLDYRIGITTIENKVFTLIAKTYKRTSNNNTEALVRSLRVGTSRPWSDYLLDLVLNEA